MTTRPAISPARALVTARVVRQARRFPRLAIDPLETRELDPRDAALARAIDRAVARRWLTLVAVVDACLDRGWPDLEPVVQGPLLAGAAQLLLLERIPDHAAIGEAVGWTAASRRPAAAALVNAVLRRVADLREAVVDVHDPARRDEVPLADGRAWRLSRAIFAEDELRRLEQTTSTGRALLTRWADRFGMPVTADLASHGLMPAPIILSGVPADGAELVAHRQEGFVVYTGPGRRLAGVLAGHPGALVQDPTTAAAVQATASLCPATIVDVCAGLGTKTHQLARLHPGARIVAAEVEPRRLTTLRREFEDDERVLVTDANDLGRHAGTADLLVLDVPCSNSAVLARRVEAKYRFDQPTLESLVSRQRQILADAMRLLADDGTLLYSTCSLEEEENEQQARWIARWHRLRITAMWSRRPTGRPGDPVTEYTDGGFFALLKR